MSRYHEQGYSQVVDFLLNTVGGLGWSCWLQVGLKVPDFLSEAFNVLWYSRNRAGVWLHNCNVLQFFLSLVQRVRGLDNRYLLMRIGCISKGNWHLAQPQPGLGLLPIGLQSYPSRQGSPSRWVCSKIPRKAADFATVTTPSPILLFLVHSSWRLLEKSISSGPSATWEKKLLLLLVMCE